jgi:hypothetical protein
MYHDTQFSSDLRESARLSSDRGESLGTLPTRLSIASMRFCDQDSNPDMKWSDPGILCDDECNYLVIAALSLPERHLNLDVG